MVNKSSSIGMKYDATRIRFSDDKASLTNLTKPMMSRGTRKVYPSRLDAGDNG